MIKSIAMGIGERSDSIESRILRKRFLLFIDGQLEATAQARYAARKHLFFSRIHAVSYYCSKAVRRSVG